MRILVAAVAAAVFMLAIPLQAAPMPKAAALHGLSALQPTAGGCGAGWHRQYWRDAAGVQHSRCVPN